ncbi:acetyl-CoA C-acetyltransferase [Allohahella marinimesophila]|uniref:Acetyl-CoA C-acetyltransferase n=1 Tax=Allohahella marinimesophila TaxID=1054972 RepID=A0ABP7PSH8_9GAMM
MSNPVYVIDGARTPFLKAHGRPGPFSPVDLAVQCGRPLLLRQNFSPDLFDQVILGCVNVLPDEMNPARIAALRLGMGDDMKAFTVQINCGSGMQSIDTAYRYIQDGSADLILAGGTEALSQAPMVLKPEAVEWFASLRQQSSPAAYVKQLREFDSAFLIPEISLKSGLTDPIVGLSMGQTAEVVAQLFNITREQADEYAVRSHHRLAKAQDEGWLDDEVVTIISRDGECFDRDDGVRPDTTVEQLASLKPVFEPPYGQVTAGNSSQVTDGACWTILASEKMVEKLKLTPKAQIVDSQWSALDPKIMGLAPVIAVTEMLKRQNRQLQDIDLWELNEAFAAQVLGCLRAWDDDAFMQAATTQGSSLGRIDESRLNIDGGAVSLGHPVGASGNRIVLHLANAMQRKQVKQGVASECIGGGQSGAMLLQAV